MNSSVLTDSYYDTIEVFTDPISVPVKETAYCYTVFDFSSMPMTHIIAVEPVVPIAQIHHFVGYMCTSNPASSKGIRAGGQNTCSNGAYDPEGTDECTKAYFLWGKGGPTVIFPSNMGKPIGQGPYQTQVKG